jgi:hypothetical protein
MKKTMLALALTLCAPAAFGQGTADLDQTSRNPTAAVKTVERAAEAAAVAASTAPAEIPFEAILGRPDDVGLNERYAFQQIREGDVRGASTTLERVLLVAPKNYRARLLYAVVLVRLDDDIDATIELDRVLRTPDLPPDMAAEAKTYARLVKRRRRRSHFDARLTFGFGVDDDRNSAPTSGQRFVLGVPFTLSADSRRKADTNLQFVGSVGASRDVFGPSGDKVFADFTYYRAEQRVYDLLNLQAYSPKLGALIHTRWLDLTPTVSFDHVLLSQSTYLRSRNAGLRADKRLSDDWRAWASYDYAYQDFVNTPRVTYAAERTGAQHDWQVGASWTPTPIDRLSATFLHRRKFAKNTGADAYRRESPGIEWLHLLGRGRFIDAGLTLQFDRYESPDPAVFPGVVREDNAMIPQIMYGQPLDLLWSRLEGFTASVGYQFFWEDSNVGNYRYTNNKATAFVSYKWGI